MSEPIPVTVIVPVKNEEKNLPVCLAQTEGFRKVVVVDSGSTDATVAIARAAGAQVVQFRWDGKFPKKRNWVLQTYKFETPWVLFIDADEFMTPAFRAEVRAAVADTELVGFMLRYRNHFLGRVLKHGFELRKLALFRVGAGFYERIEEDRWSGLDMEVHEYPVLSGSVGLIRAPIDHDDFRDLHHYVERHNDYSSWEAHRYHTLRNDPEAWSRLTRLQKFKYANLARVWYAPAFFLGSYFVKGGFLDGWAGFVFCALKAEHFFNVYCKTKALKRPLAAEARGGRGMAPK